MKKLCTLLLLASVLALLCAAAMADDTVKLYLYQGAGVGGTISETYTQGDVIPAPECPDSYSPPNEHYHFGSWYDSNHSAYYQPGDSITMNGNVNLTAQWYLNSEYDFSGTLSNGMTWEMHISVGAYDGNPVAEETYGSGKDRRYIRDGYLNITGSGDMPSFTGEHSAPWDQALYDLWRGGNGLNGRTISHSDVGGSWQEAVPIEITLDDRITSIGSYSFTGSVNTLFETIHLPSGLQRIESYAFYNNYYLFDVQLPDGLTYIGDYAFYGCHEMVATTDEILSFYYTSYAHSRPYTGLLVIPDSVTEIGSYAFSGTAIYRVAFPHGLKHISDGIFYNVRDLNYAYLPDVLESIGDYAFYGCGTSYEFPNNNGYGQAEMRDYSLTVVPYSEVTDLLMISGLTAIHLPATLRTLGEYSFFNCSDAYSVVIPEGVTEIPAYCFARCRNLRSVTLPESLRIIGEGAFNKTYYLGATVSEIQEITIPRGVTQIYDYSLGFRDKNNRLYMKVFGYRNTEAERYTNWGNAVDLSGTSYSQGTWTFVPLDKEDLYLFGVIDSAPYACGTDAGSLGSYKFTETETAGVYTLTASLPGDSYVGLKRDKDDKDGADILYYSAAAEPGESVSAVLTDRGETTDTGHLLKVPGLRKVIFTLIKNGDGSFTLSYELPTDYEICGALTDWSWMPLAYNGVTGKYEYTAELNPAHVWNGMFEFYLNLNDDDYGAKEGGQYIYGSTEDLPLYAMIDPDGNYDDSVGNMRLCAPASGNYTFIFDDSACTLTVTNDVAESTAWLMIPQISTIPTRMVDPTVSGGDAGVIEDMPIDEDMPIYEEDGGGGSKPDDPYLFDGEDTVWAAVVLYDGDENPYTFYIGQNGSTYGDNAIEYQEYYGDSAKSVKLMGSQWTRLVEGQTADVRVADERSGVYDFYYGLETHRVMVKRRTVDYTIAYSLDMTYTGERDSFYLETFVTPALESANVIWYSVADGVKAEYTDAYYHYEYGEENTYTHYYGPSEVGDYMVEVWDNYGGLAVRHTFSIAPAGGVQGGEHTYELLGELDKRYDGEPVAFDPNDAKQFAVDGGKTEWGALEKNGEARCIWRQKSEKGYIDMEGVPTEIGQYQLVIQEGNEKEGYADAAVFDFAVTEAHEHQYGAPEWQWANMNTTNGYIVTASFTCSVCGDVQRAVASVGYRLANGQVEYVATAAFDGQIYTDSRAVGIETLILPAGLTAIESKAFAGIPAQAVVIPASVTDIAGDAFEDCPNLLTVYGYEDTAAADFAQSHSLSFEALAE